MRRPSRKVVRVENFDMDCRDYVGLISGTVEMVRLHLECGHHVDVRRSRSGRCRVRCAICQGKRIGKWDIWKRDGQANRRVPWVRPA